MQTGKKGESPLHTAAAAGLMKNREAISRLAQSGDARKLMELLRRQGGVQEAAQAAAGGDASQLMAMMNQLMNSKEGAALVERIGEQAKREGLGQQ